MKKIEAIVRAEHIEKIKERLIAIGVPGMTITRVVGWSKERAMHLHFRGTEFELDLLPRAKVEVIVSDNQSEQVIQAILESARTGEPGDGLVLVQNLDETLSIRTGEKSRMDLQA